MSNSNSIQHKLSRVRPPRVQITYDVETGGALEKKELPFIVGILADLSHESVVPKKSIREKKLVQIDRDNFNKVMKSIEPRVAFDVRNTLGGNGVLLVDIPFQHIDDFDPVKVVSHVPALNKLYGQRSRLRDFLSKLDGNDTLNSILVDVYFDDKRKEALRQSVTEAKAHKAIESAVVKSIETLSNPEDAVLKAKQEQLETNLEKLRLLRQHDKIASDVYEATLRTAFNATIDDKNQFTDEALNADIKAMLSTGQLILEPAQTPYALELVVEFVEQILTSKPTAKTEDKAATEEAKPETEAGAEKDTANADANKTPTNTSEDASNTKEAEDVNITGLITLDISRKDKRISRQLNYIIHDKKFQQCEATWRGLHFLVMNTETNNKLKLKVLDVTQKELFKDLDKAAEFDQSTLFKIIYEEEYGTFGGEPYSVLIGDYQFGREPQDIKFLEMISGVAAAAHAPFIASAYAKLFDLEEFGSLHKPRDLSKIFESAELIQWRAFREMEDSRYVTLTLPRVMMRLPYHHEKNPVEGIYFDEDVAVTLFDEKNNPILVDDPNDKDVQVEKTRKTVDAQKVLWGNPAYILGQRITNAFSLHGWTAAIRGVEGGGLVEGLPAYTFETEDGDLALNCPTEVSITDRREKELNDLGFMAICHCKGTNKAAFFGGQSTNSPKQYLTDSATANARISSMLPYVMSASRFAHYIKVLMREKIGSFMTRQNVENYLNTWIAQYVLLDDTPPQHIKAKYPLREARIDVTEVPGKPGAYRATVFLRPHFQLEELSTSIRLVADLPS
ncbi:type VI secretion system contractile sheath large subunit [Alteromonas sp. a30]|uniref:type VI secretion system contractile sheath large subunit n=1 Tax=Alteromonas sp. a30 TaxID=2730917 RepID=UPI00227FEFF8|nr:type VI secretion system contractile sheath large subunit [Alteromonas sp. a30]MCY7293837.1 type VI secretion system contractile sheath large subunit [Alteromonas sp. a30]